MNALQLKEGKFWLVPDVPEKPCKDKCESSSYCFDNCSKKYAYNEKLNQALSNSIEVAEESEELAKVLMANECIDGGIKGMFDQIMFDRTVKEGELYPIEGLTYEVNRVSYCPYSRCNTESWGCTDENDCQLNFKQVAIINK